MHKIAVLVSGGGTNLQALIHAQEAGRIPNGQISLVLASNSKAYALERAKKHGIESLVLSKKDYSTLEEWDAAMVDALLSRGIDRVVLAGYLSYVGPKTIRAFENHMINIHPSLIPSFCGKGYYGLKVHEAALAYGVKVTGATVHYVNEIYDNGKILLQKPVLVEEGDTPEILQRRVMEQAEWEILPKAVAMICEQD